jgi:hypothetical protein
MKRFAIVLSLLLFAASGIRAQKLENHGLVVTGSVHKVEAKCQEGKPLFAVHISLQIRNDSPKPLIFFGWFGVSTETFNFVSTLPGSTNRTVVAAEVVRYNPYQEDPFGPGSPDDYDPYASLVANPKGWEAPEPLAPGGYLERPRQIWLTSGFKLSEKGTQAFKACKPMDETPMPDYPAFYIEHRTSLKKYPNGENVMRMLEERWKSIGVLPLDSSGDITYRSEPIIFPSPK